MTNKQALIDLRDKVKAGDFPDTGVDRFRAIPERGGGVYADPNRYSAHGAYWRGSLDDAKALHDAVLDGWDFSLGVESAEVADYPHRCGMYFIANNESPARAWLLAILEALIAVVEQ